MKASSTALLPRDPREALALAREGTLPCERLAGDASDRTFWRIRFAGEARTAILVRGAEFPFVETARLLRGAGVPAPEIHAEDPVCGLVVEEDFGDTLLEEAATGQPREVPSRYRALVDLLHAMQARFPRRSEAEAAPLALRRAFDAATFERELRIFEEHLWKGHLGARPTEEETCAFRAHARRLAETVAALPPRFAHRDFHARNILVRPDGSFGIVDFQDARFGPPHYDLASLLFDGYVRLEPDLVEELFQRFEEASPSFPDPPSARAAFELTAAQRVLKALGSFGYLARIKGKTRFLDYVPKALEDAVCLLGCRRELAPLHAILAAGHAAFAG
ncbi:MAG TPA: phosphotransferase [Planctomycetota bacterium]|nr:phosphotransferase [Planctomycetota bacterium]